MKMLTLDGCLDTLMENTFNQVTDIYGGDFDDLGMEDEGEQNLVTIDSRLDVESVLIEDIKLDLDAIDHNLTEYENYQHKVQKSEAMNHKNKNHVNKVIKSESNIENDENVETLCPQQRDRCNTWPRQMQGERYA
jgi:hypothetical protein